MASLTFIERVIPAVQLRPVMILEAVVEVLEEPIEGGGGLVGQFREGERIRIAVHVIEPRRHDAVLAVPAS